MINSFRRYEYSINNNHEKSFGGYILYWKLTFELIGKSIPFTKTLKPADRVSMWWTILYKLPWWLFIKPLGKMFKVKSKYVGNYNSTIDNPTAAQVDGYNINKTVTVFFLGLPIYFKATNKLKDSDWEKIIKEKK